MNVNLIFFVGEIDPFFCDFVAHCFEEDSLQHHDLHMGFVLRVLLCDVVVLSDVVVLLLVVLWIVVCIVLLLIALDLVYSLVEPLGLT